MFCIYLSSLNDLGSGIFADKWQWKASSSEKEDRVKTVRFLRSERMDPDNRETKLIASFSTSGKRMNTELKTRHM